MKDFRLCPLCGDSLISKAIEGRDRKICENCNWIYYKNPLPAVACLASNKKGEILLIKRAVEPYMGEWCIPGGFIEIDETLEEAGVRELEEETGIKGRAGDVIGAYIQKSRMYGAVLIVGLEFTIEEALPVAGDDAREARFTPLDSIPDIPLESHRKLLRKYLQL